MLVTFSLIFVSLLCAKALLIVFFLDFTFYRFSICFSYFLLLFPTLLIYDIIV